MVVEEAVLEADDLEPASVVEETGRRLQWYFRLLGIIIVATTALIPQDSPLPYPQPVAPPGGVVNPNPVPSPSPTPTPTPTPTPITRKTCNPANFIVWWNAFPPRLWNWNQGPTGPTDAMLYQLRVAGPEERQVTDTLGGAAIWADGSFWLTCSLLDAKHAGPQTQFRIDPPPWIGATLTNEFERYRAVVQDPLTPATNLLVITNREEALPLLLTTVPFPEKMALLIP